MFTPKNVSQLVVATTDVTTAYNAAVTAKARKATLVNVGDYAITASPAFVPAAPAGDYTTNASAGIIVKTATGIKVSEQVVLADLDSYIASTLVAGTAQVLTATYPAVAASTTYLANVILHDGIGSFLNERIVNASVSVSAGTTFIDGDGVAQTATLTAVLAELAGLLQASLDQSNEGFVVTSTATTLVVTGSLPQQRIGATDGIANPFELRGGVKSAADASGAFYTQTATVAVTTPSRPDDLVQLKNLEWFTSGYDKDPYRDIAWPVSFAADSNVGAAGVAIGDDLAIYQFHKDRLYTNIERQHRQLIVVGAGFSAIKTALDAATTVV